MELLKEMQSKIVEAYEKLNELPKPDAYKIGGTYYGSTQLYKSVGNMLDLIEDEPYTQHSYGYNLRYKHLWGIRIGGAYKGEDVDIILRSLKDALRENVPELGKIGCGMVNDYGTNYSVIGVVQN